MSKHEKPICASNMQKIIPYIANCNTIFEIGAYDGVDIDEIKEHFGNQCQIHAFEPDPESFFQLNNLYEKEGVICNNIALSNYIGKTIKEVMSHYDKPCFVLAETISGIVTGKQIGRAHV